MPDRQPIFVVSTSADEAELQRVRGDLGRDPVVLTAPTAEAKRVVGALGVEPRVEVLLAPASFPPPTAVTAWTSSCGATRCATASATSSW